jgi:sulfotransferase family protein
VQRRFPGPCCAPAIVGAVRVSGGPPILVTGAHRSGTTWVGKMLALAPGVAYLHEPFNPRTPAGLSAAPFDRYFTVVTAENEGRYLPGLERTLAFRFDVGAQLRSQCGPSDLVRAGRDLARTLPPRLTGARPLVKDPIALLSAEWLAGQFGMQVVVLVRHPAAFAASLKRLGYRHDFGSFVVDGSVPEIVRPYEAEIREQAERPGDVLAQASLFWRILYGAVEGYRTRHPDWTYLRHEDASVDPLGTFERLYATLGLEFVPKARREIEQATSGSDNPAELRNPHDVKLASAVSLGRWRTQLTPEEIAFLRESTRDVWPSFYSDEEW